MSWVDRIQTNSNQHEIDSPPDLVLPVPHAGARAAGAAAAEGEAE